VGSEKRGNRNAEAVKLAAAAGSELPILPQITQPRAFQRGGDATICPPSCHPSVSVAGQNQPVQWFIARVAVAIGPRNGTLGRLGEAEADLPVQQPVQ